MGAPYPVLLPEAFGITAAGPYITNPIPKTTGAPGAASYDIGFPPLTMTAEIAGGVPPFGQDMNGILYALSTHSFFQQSGGLYLFNSATATALGGYAAQTILASTDGVTVWYNTVNNNMTDPDSGTNTGWVPFYSYGIETIPVTGGSVTLDEHQAARDILNFTGALGSNQTVVLPNNVQQWIIINATTGPHTLTLKTAAGTGVVIPQTGPSAASGIYGDGTNIYLTSVSTAGLAPLASPAFTGVPTAPTAAPGTNTTQLATTGYVFGNFAPLASPVFTGNPRAPTPTAGDNSTSIATTAFIAAALASVPFIGTSPGCARLPGLVGQRLLLQWGSVSKSAGATPVTVNFPQGYTNVFGAFLQDTGNMNNGFIQRIVPGSLNNSGFQIGIDAFDNSHNPTITVYWFAIGL